MKIGSHEFNIRELGGSMGDFGTLFPLAVGYIAICGVDPAGILLMLGLANIATGIAYRLPMPVEPMKVLAIVAIAKAWSPSMVYASAFAMGLVWLLMFATNAVSWVARVTPRSVSRGLQVSLGFMLSMEALDLAGGGWLLFAISLVIIIILRDSSFAPAAVVLMILGFVIAYLDQRLIGMSRPAFSLPTITSFSAADIWATMIAAGFAQIPLTAANSMIATSELISSYFPGRKVTVRQLSLSLGLMNILSPFFSGMPLCHGAGGLAGQYYFGARTGGTNIIEGTIEILLGLFFSGSIAVLFTAFPQEILGGMLLVVGISMLKFARGIEKTSGIVPFAGTVLVAVLTNMAIGFLAGLFLHYTIKLIAPGWFEEGGPLGNE